MSSVIGSISSNAKMQILQRKTTDQRQGRPGHLPASAFLLSKSFGPTLSNTQKNPLDLTDVHRTMLLPVKDSAVHLLIREDWHDTAVWVLAVVVDEASQVTRVCCIDLQGSLEGNTEEGAQTLAKLPAAGK